MLTHNDLKKGVRFILEAEPYEMLQAEPMKKAQGRIVIQSKVRNLISGNVFSKNFHQGEVFQEAELLKFPAKFIYSQFDRKAKGSEGGIRKKFVFCREDNHAQRFDLSDKQIGSGSEFLKEGQIIDAIAFQDKIINVALPIKIKLKVTQAPPGEKGGRAQSGTKQVSLESGAKINVPLFIEQGDTIEVNTESGEYVRRVQ